MKGQERWYHRPDGESAAEREIVELVGRIVIAWGAIDTVMAKLWWHLAFEAGQEIDRDRAYRATLDDKLKAIRKLVLRDGGRRDFQLHRLEVGIPEYKDDRHALAHGYIGMTARGPAAINLRTDRAAMAIDLPSLHAWSAFFADVAHQMYEEETVRYYRGEERLYLPDPLEPPPHKRTPIPGWP